MTFSKNTQYLGKYYVKKWVLSCALLLGNLAFASTQQIKEQIVDFLSEQAQPYANSTFSHIDVTLAPNSDTRLAKADCTRPTINLTKGASPVGRTSVTLSCSDTPWKLRLSAHVALINTVPVASRTLSPGTALTSTDWLMTEVDITLWPRGVILDGSALDGVVTNRQLKAGEPIPPQNNGTSADTASIKAGSHLDILIIGEGFIVRSSGSAIQSGKPGDTIRAKLESGKTVTGTLNAEKQLEVRI